MFSLITAQALTAPFTTTGHTGEILTPTPERRDTALTNLFVGCSHMFRGEPPGSPFLKERNFKMELINTLAMSDPESGKILGVVIAKILIIGFFVYQWKKDKRK